MGAVAVLIKHIHVWLVILSVTGFLLRFVWSLKNSAVLQRKAVKIVPHIVDTLLLLTGVSLALIFRYSPFHIDWLGTKLVLIVVYILLGGVAMRPALPRRIRQMVGCLALLTVLLIMHLAIYKPILF